MVTQEWNEISKWYLAHGYTAAVASIVDAQRGVWARKPDLLLALLRASDELLRPSPVKNPSADTMRRDKQFSNLIESAWAA